MECELLRSPMILYRSLLYNTTVLYDKILSSTVFRYFETSNRCHTHITILLNSRYIAHP